jgi:hypothetical protein
MNAKILGMMAALVLLAEAGLFVALNGFAADAQILGNGASVTANAMSNEVKIPESPASQWQVVDSSGKVYLLTPMQTKDSKAFVKSAPLYTSPARAGKPVR